MAGIALPQLAPASEDRVSGAQVIDGSLKFDRAAKTHLLKTFSTVGSSSRFTWSYWIKRTTFGVGDQRVFSSSAGSGSPGFVNWFTSNDVLEARHYNGSAWDVVFQTTNKFRDNGWYHIVCTVDVTEQNSTDRVKIYVNGTRETQLNTTTYGPARYAPLVFNGSNKSAVGSGTADGNEALDAHLSNYYAIDGFALGPESFGYTDPLTGVWRPKKFSGELNPPFSDNWEGDTTGTGFNADTNKQNAFDGNPNTQAATGQNGTMSFTPTPAITGISKVRIKARRDAGANVDANFTLNGTTIGNLWTAGNIATVEITSLGGSPISQLTNLTWKGNTNNNEWFGVYMIEVYSNGAYHTLRQGGNAFYLPMDGDSQIGIDQSGKGNDFQPRNFGGSNSIEKATGARPILNTVNGGRNASAGVFGSKVSATYTTTSASNSGGKYVFEGLGTQPTFSFVRGATYTFDWSASSGHPLRFATAADAAGSTEYTDGTNVSGNVTKITVPHNAPDTLYYYCNVHNGMGNSISVTTDETAADPYAWKNVLAMPLLGNKDDKSTSINCTQSAAKAITANGNAAGSVLHSNFYGGSYYLDGNGDYLSLTNSGDFAYGTGDFTIESWIYPTNISNYKNFYEGNTNGSTTASVRLQIKNTGVIEYLVNNVGRSTAQVVPANEWTHVALTRASNTVRLFINGVNVDEYTNNGDLTSQSLQIGRTHDNYDYVGYIQDYRVYKGVAKYTSNFIPASTSPDVLPDSPSSTALKGKLTDLGDLFTTGAVSFDGSGDYLDLPTSSDFGLAGGDNFTIECFVYTRNGSELIRQGTANAGSDGMYFSIASSGVLETRISGTTKSTTGKIIFNSWNHISVCRSSGTLYMSINGVVESFGSVTNASTTGAFKIGSNFEENSFFRGHISNVRFIKGTALYTSNFNPPTESLTNVTNTKLLCCQSNTSATESAVIPTGSITANGNAAATTFNPFNSVIDAVRGQEGNYCTWNPLRNGATLSNGNLDLSTSNNPRNTFGTIGVSSGKWFWEVTINSIANTHYPVIGVNTDLSQELDQQSGGANDPDGYMLLASGLTFNNDDTASYGPGSSAGDVIGVALDMDAGTISFHHNGVNLGVALSGITGTAVPAVVSWTGATCTANFGQKPFKFPPPVGHQPLQSPRTVATDTTPTITRPGDFVGATTYTGNNTNPRNLGLGHPTDLVWIKKRNATENNNISDSVRGPNNWISSDNNNAANTSGGPVLGFNDDGVTVDNNGYVNGNNDKYVAWSWRAGGKDGSNAFNIDDVGYATAAAAQQSVGSQNSSGYDTSDVWSDDLSSPNGAYSGSSVTSAFNGNLTNGFEAGNPSSNYSTIRFQPASPITVNTQIRIHVFDLNDSNVTYQWRVNDGSWNNMPGTSSPYRRWQDLSFTGSLTSFEYRSNTSITYKPTLYAVEIDGKLLIDTGTDLSGLTQYPSIAPAGSSVGTKQGFSILKWNSGGSNGNFTLAHGLGREPKFIITRSLASAHTWVYHKSQVGTDYRKHLQLNSNAGGQSNSANFWGESGHTDTLYGVRVGDLIGQNQDAISYLWADVPGLQKFGSYKANGDGSGGGDEDGPFIDLGFRPAMILFKGNHTSDWTWIDNARCTTNYNDVALRANYHYSEIGNARGGVGSSSQPENYAVDFLSNGFKIRASGGSLNGGTNIIYYAAWAEAPAFNLYGAQSNAR